MNELMSNGHELLVKMEADPESYDIPQFGPCLTYPYRYYEVEWNGKKIRCTG